MRPQVQRTEPSEWQDNLDSILDSYIEQVEAHPISKLCCSRSLSKATLQAFAKAQYVDSTTWVAMLGLVKGNVKSSALREAVTKNILDEVGASGGRPHVTLCKEFLASVNVEARYMDIREYSPASVYPVGLMLGLAGNCADTTIGGWILSQEILVPAVFRTFRPAFAVFENPSVTYLTEHEEVDKAEHSRWIKEALSEIITNDGELEAVIAGLHMGGRATLAVLDYLYASELSASPHLTH